MNTFLVAALIVLVIYTAFRDRKRIRESVRQQTADVIQFQHRELTIRKRRDLRQRVVSINPRPYSGDAA